MARRKYLTALTKKVIMQRITDAARSAAILANKYFDENDFFLTLTGLRIENGEFYVNDNKMLFEIAQKIGVVSSSETYERE